MAFGRRSRSLARTAARAAVITGTVAATSNAVNGRAAQKQAAQNQAAAAPQVVPVAVVAQPIAPADISDDVIAKIERLAALHSAGALTAEEFALLKTQAIA